MTNLPASGSRQRALTESRGVRWVLIGVALLYLGLFLGLPLTIVFSEALSKGLAAYRAAV